MANKPLELYSMKTTITILFLTVLLVPCQAQPAVDAGSEAFAKNSATVMKYVQAFQAESMDYDAFFAENAIIRGTSFGQADSNSVADKMNRDKEMWAKYDFKLVNKELNLLPGVNAETKKMDGSVRYYALWEVTRTATDAAPAKSGIIKGYTSYDFNKEGKIMYMQFYGDAGGLMKHLNSAEKK